MKWKEFQDHYDEWSESTLLNRISQLESLGTTAEIADVANYMPEAGSKKLIRKAVSGGLVFQPEDIIALDGVIDEAMMEELVSSSIDAGVIFSFDDLNGLDGLISEATMSSAMSASLRQGVIFTPAQIIEMDGLVDEDTLTAAVRKVKTGFTKRELEDLEGLVDYDVLLEIDRKQKSHVFDENIDDEDYEETDDVDDGELFDDEPDFESVYTTEFMDGKQGKGLGKLFSGLAFLGMMGEMQRKSKPQRFRVGDHVRVKYRGQEGTIVDINGDQYMVSLKDGGYVDSYYESQIERAW